MSNRPKLAVLFVMVQWIQPLLSAATMQHNVANKVQNAGTLEIDAFMNAVPRAVLSATAHPESQTDESKVDKSMDSRSMDTVMNDPNHSPPQ